MNYLNLKELLAKAFQYKQDQRITELEDRLKDAEKALSFYANENTWQKITIPDFFHGAHWPAFVVDDDYRILKVKGGGIAPGDRAKGYFDKWRGK